MRVREVREEEEEGRNREKNPENGLENRSNDKVSDVSDSATLVLFFSVSRLRFYFQAFIFVLDRYFWQILAIRQFRTKILKDNRIALYYWFLFKRSLF